jgi:hypothetical protein
MNPSLKPALCTRLRVEIKVQRKSLRIAGCSRFSRAGSKASPITNAGPKRLWRKDGQVFHRAVEAVERLAYIEARRGTTFGDICTLLEFQNAGEKITERVASFLGGWFRDGLVSRVSVGA